MVWVVVWAGLPSRSLPHFGNVFSHADIPVNDSSSLDGNSRQAVGCLISHAGILLPQEMALRRPVLPSTRRVGVVTRVTIAPNLAPQARRPIDMDTSTACERSERMSRIKGKKTKPELAVRRLVYRMGYLWRLWSCMSRSQVTSVRQFMKIGQNHDTQI